MSAVFAPRATPTWTVEQYLALERNAETRHEYENGVIIPMSGAKPNHNRISANLIRLFLGLFENNERDVFGSNQRVRVDDGGPFYYPDVVVSDGESIFDDDYCLRNPFLIVEVLSESTEQRDRVSKYRNCRRMPYLRHYILISQDEVFVEHWHKGEDGLWSLIGELESQEVTLALPGIDGRITVSEIYRRVVW